MFPSGAGFVGGNIGTIKDCYSTGLVSGTAGLLQGFCAGKEGDIIDCFWDEETSGQLSSDGGTGAITDDMTSWPMFDYVYWSHSIWNINPACNDGYPCLINVTPACLGTCKVFLIGYTQAGVLWNTNAVPITPTALATWETSGLLPTNSIGAIVEVVTNADLETGIRRYGSVENVKGDANQNAWLMSEVSNRRADLYRESADVSMFLLGVPYSKGAPAFLDILSEIDGELEIT